MTTENKRNLFNFEAIKTEQSGTSIFIGVARATSLITSLRPVYVWLRDAIGILEQECTCPDDEIVYMYDLVKSYWNALKDVVPAAFEKPNDYVIQKTPGLFSLHKLLRHLLGNMYMGRRDFSTETFVEFLSVSPEITDSDFWHKDADRASVYGSMKGFQDLYEFSVSHIVGR